MIRMPSRIRTPLRAFAGALVLTLCGSPQAEATGTTVLLRVLEARADFECGQLFIRGQNLVRSVHDTVYVSLSGDTSAFNLLSLFGFFPIASPALPAAPVGTNMPPRTNMVSAARP